MLPALDSQSPTTVLTNSTAESSKFLLVPTCQNRLAAETRQELFEHEWSRNEIVTFGGHVSSSSLLTAAN